MGVLHKLYDDQQLALDDLKQSLRTGHRRPLLQLSTGGGKTVIAAHIVAGALAKRKRIAFTVPLLNLIEQTFERFVENGIEPGDMGVVQGDHEWRRPHAPVQICSVQTLGRRGYPDVDIVVVDEAHLNHKAIDQWMAEQPEMIFIGLSATPWTRGLGKKYDDLICPITMAELIARGRLSKFRVFAPSHPDLTGVKIIAGDYHEGQLSERVNRPKIVADVVCNWVDKAEGRPTLVFAVDRAHAEALHDQFRSVGVVSEYVDANTTREERTAIGKRFNNGDVQVICSIGTMTTGVDLDIRCIVFARPTKSEILFVQCIGRGLRVADGKDYCLIFDHSDTHLRLGMVTDINHESLSVAKQGEGGGDPDRKTKVDLPIDCPTCTYLIPARVRECPNCGFMRKRFSTVQAEEGELMEIGAIRKSALKNNREMSWDEKAQFMAELKGYARENNFKEGWPAQKYKSRTGVWPNDPRVRYVNAKTCTPAVRSWIRSQNIRWAKGNQKRSVDEVIADSMKGARNA